VHSRWSWSSALTCTNAARFSTAVDFGEFLRGPWRSGGLRRRRGLIPHPPQVAPRMHHRRVPLLALPRHSTRTPDTCILTAHLLSLTFCLFREHPPVLDLARRSQTRLPGAQRRPWHTRRPLPRSGSCAVRCACPQAGQYPRVSAQSCPSWPPIPYYGRYCGRASRSDAARGVPSHGQALRAPRQCCEWQSARDLRQSHRSLPRPGRSSARRRNIHRCDSWGSGSVRTKNGGKAVVSLPTERSQPTT
jgi:hypothetical protein